VAVAIQHVVARPTAQHVIPAPATQELVRDTTNENVIPVAARQHAHPGGGRTAEHAISALAASEVNRAADFRTQVGQRPERQPIIAITGQDPDHEMAGDPGPESSARAMDALSHTPGADGQRRPRIVHHHDSAAHRHAQSIRLAVVSLERDRLKWNRSELAGARR
jgi:hypothetical protein